MSIVCARCFALLIGSSAIPWIFVGRCNARILLIKHFPTYETGDRAYYNNG